MDHDTRAHWAELDADGRAFLAATLGEPDSLAPGTPEPEDLADLLGPADDSTTSLIELLEAAVSAGASDVHVSAHMPPLVRVQGELRPLAGAEASDAGALERSLHTVLTDDQRAALMASGDIDLGFSLQLDGTPQRFRASVFRQAAGVAAAIRIVPSHIPPLEELHLPPVLRRFVRLTSGLVVVTGPTGSGKSTTLAAMIEEINRSRSAHIVTIEDPIEYQYSSKRALIHQREVGIDTVSFANALRHALRQDPDVILIGELRDLETIRIALTAAETGHVVFATLHSVDAPSAVNRIIDVFPADQQAQVRSQLALSLEGSISQRLLAGRHGRLLPATEVLVATSGVRNLIREGKAHQIPTLLETGHDVGMHTFDQSLTDLVRRGLIDVETARTAGSSGFESRIGS